MLVQLAVNEFWAGHGGADAVARPIVAPGYAPQKVLQGVRVRAATANTIVIYVGRVGVTVAGGYPLPAGEELQLYIEDPSTIYVVATPAANSEQVVTIAGDIVGETFTLTLDGQTTAPLAVEAAAAAVEDALEALSNIGVGNVSVSGNAGGPYTVEFIVALAKTDVSLLVGVDGGINEKQTVVVTDGAANDKLILTYSGQSTAELAYNATSAQIATALKLLNNIGDTDVAVTDGDPAGWVVEFIGALAKTDVAAITGVCGKNEKQTVVVTDGAANDKLILTYSGQSTAELAYDATSAQIATALKLLNNIGDNDVAVTDGDPAGWVVEFIGALAKTDVVAITGVCGKNEKQTVVVTGGAANDKLILTYSGQSTGELAYDATSAQIATALKLLNNIGDNDVAVMDGDPAGWVVEFIGALAKTNVVAITGVCGKNEKQTVGIPDTVDIGTFTLTYSGQTTAAIAYNANAAAVQTALEDLSNVEVGDVEVTGGPGPSADWVVEFKGTLAKTDVAAMTGNGTNLVGGSTTVTITETVKGVTESVTIAELVKGNLATVGVTETVKGNLAAVGVTETVKGNLATVTVTETQKGDASFTVTVTKNDVVVGSQYSWIAQ